MNFSEIIRDIIHCVTSDIARRWDHNCVTTTNDEPIRARRRCDVTRPFHQWDAGSFLLLSSMACFLFCCNVIVLPGGDDRLHLCNLYRMCQKGHKVTLVFNRRKISDIYEVRENRAREKKKIKVPDVEYGGVWQLSHPGSTRDKLLLFRKKTNKKTRNKQEKRKGWGWSTCVVMQSSDWESWKVEGREKWDPLQCDYILFP